MRRSWIYLFVFFISASHMAFSQKLQHDWENYVTSIRDKPVSVNVDLGIRPFVPLIDLPFVIVVRLKLQQTNDAGMPVQEEVVILNDLEEKLTDQLSRGQGALYVGRFTQRGIREYYFYTSDTLGYQPTLVSVFASFPSYQWLAQSKKDEAWQNYLNVLYPSELDKMLIESRRQLSAFLKDNASIPKKTVSYFFEFPDDASCKLFLQTNGFSKYTVNQYTRKLGGKGISMMFSSIESIDRKWVETTMPVLFSESKKHGGLYKGWEID
jgi:hypothetical protein